MVHSCTFCTQVLIWADSSSHGGLALFQRLPLVLPSSSRLTDSKLHGIVQGGVSPQERCHYLHWAPANPAPVWLMNSPREHWDQAAPVLRLLTSSSAFSDSLQFPPSQKLHKPLLLSLWSYTTYQGSLCRAWLKWNSLPVPHSGWTAHPTQQHGLHSHERTTGHPFAEEVKV